MLDWEFWMLTHNSPGLAAEDEAAAVAEDEAAAVAEGEAAAAEDEAAAAAEGEEAGDAEVVTGVGSGWHWELTADAAMSTAAEGMPCPAPERPQASRPPIARPIASPIPGADARGTRAEVADRVTGTPGRIRWRVRALRGRTSWRACSRRWLRRVTRRRGPRHRRVA